MSLKKSFAEFFREEKAQSEMNAVFMLLVVAIAAALIIGLIKPMFMQSGKTVQKSNTVQAQASTS